jgi:hypothetical protein
MAEQTSEACYSSSMGECLLEIIICCCRFLLWQSKSREIHTLSLAEDWSLMSVYFITEPTVFGMASNGLVLVSLGQVFYLSYAMLSGLTAILSKMGCSWEFSTSFIVIPQLEFASFWGFSFEFFDNEPIYATFRRNRSFCWNYLCPLMTKQKLQ